MSKNARKRKLDDEEIAMADWEKECIMSDKLLNEMKTMWEIPQIYHFLHLTKETLNIGPLSMYEMERMLMMPRASKQLAHIMTCLLSSPMLKTKLRRIPPMPYEYWTNILMHKIKSWFKIYYNKHEDTIKVLEAIGVEPAFWKIFPDVSLVEGKDFEELTFRQRVWLLKTICDTMMHTRKTVQDEIAKQLTEENSETLLGTDRHGARYIYFPQIMENDVRVYRHCLDNKILSTVEPPESKVEPKLEVKASDKKIGVLKSNRTRRRKSRWRNGSLPHKNKKRIKKQNEISNCEYITEGTTESLGSEDTNLSNISICSNNNHSDLGSGCSKRSRSSSKNSDESLISNQTKSNDAKSSGYDTNTSSDAKSNDEMPLQKEFKGFSQDADIHAQNMVVKQTMIGSITIDRLIENNDSPKADREKIEPTERKIDKINQIDKEVDEGSQDTDSNEINQHNIEKSDDQSNISESFDPKSNDVPSNHRHSTKDLASTPRTNDIDTTLKEIAVTTELQIDELSNISKTDDEKLNDIMSIDGSKKDTKIARSIITKEIADDKIESTSEVNMEKILSVSKSDDQKLIETKLKDNKIREVKIINSTSDKDVLVEKLNLALDSNTLPVDKSNNNREDKEEDEQSGMQLNDSVNENVNTIFNKESSIKSEIYDICDESIVVSSRSRLRRSVRSVYRRTLSDEDNKSECTSDQEHTLGELRDRSLKEEKDNFASSSNISIWEKYNLRKPKKIKIKETEGGIENFYEMLDDLSFSTFELVADSIEGLRNLVLSNFSENKPMEINTSNQNNLGPQCEIQLAKKINELLTTLESRRSSLTDATRKARAKLHKEWTNFKTGVVEDQDWSSEGSLGVGSNWWVIGSQGYHPLLPTSEATIPTLPQLTIPPFGTHHQTHFSDDPARGHTNHDELQDDDTKHGQQHSQGAGDNQGETQNKRISKERQLQEVQEQSRRNQPIENESNEEENLISKRVLRARGISSYTELLSTSDDDFTEDELERWSEIEAKHASTYAPPNFPAANIASTSGQAETWDSEDSDKDWILPRSCKRKNKRSVTRNLKSLQQKLQNMNSEIKEPSVSSGKTSSLKKSVKNTNNKTDPHRIDQNSTSNNLSNKNVNTKVVSDEIYSQAVPSSPICRIESVHSEIDIKDEVTLENADQSKNVNNYNLHMQSGGYVVVKTDQSPMTNYYLMTPSTSVSNIVQQNTNIMSSVVPQVQQENYYVQAGQNYIVQAPQQTNFLTTQPLQQHPTPIIAQDQQQLMGATIAQNYMQMPGYVVQQPSIQLPGPRSFIVNQNAPPHFIPPQNIRMTNQFNVRNRPALIGNGTPIPYGAVIRSSAPPRGNAGRNNKAKSKNSIPRLIASQKINPKSDQNTKKTSKLQSMNTNCTTNTTSLIVLSDSDDEIEMIITEPKKSEKTPSIVSNKKNPQKPIVTSHVTVSPANSILPPQIIQRMSQGGISITPVKTPQPQTLQNTNTQLVVVVNETGSHYALSLPNGSKLILTPEQVAQIRASNNGKLIL